ncbi:hypothetical protein [Bacillus cereus group sp. N21]|uniref:hypothetical protein n=1 Tax=Bacillus cereus group sp. N21 TaxID=2794591 RepID=UPI001F5BA5B6|nr:hypothetical protein [Bacillus cereus group sp. N21]
MIDGNKIGYRRNGLFPKRAILRVGMLLRDSEVAKEVRTQLLNIEENSKQEVKTQEIDKEMTLEMNIGRAISKGDYVAVAIAVKELEDYKNRHTYFFCKTVLLQIYLFQLTPFYWIMLYSKYVR